MSCIPELPRPRPRQVQVKNLLLVAFGVACLALTRITQSSWVIRSLGFASISHVRHPYSNIGTAALGSDATEDIWRQALAAERERSEVIFAQLEDLQDKLTGTQLEEEASAARTIYEDCAVQWGAQEFEQLQECNNRLQDGIQRLQRGASSPAEKGSSLPSWLPKGARVEGIEVAVDSLPPVLESEGSALLAGAPHVRVSLPLDGNGGLMWGCDLTPFFDGDGDNLIAFTAFHPLGMKIAQAPRPLVAPQAEGTVLVVEAVDEGSEAEVVGIKQGDFLRAVSYMGSGPQPSFLDGLLGAQPMQIKKILKCNDHPAQEVIDALESNKGSPDGMVTLLLERSQ